MYIYCKFFKLLQKQNMLEYIAGYIAVYIAGKKFRLEFFLFIVKLLCCKINMLSHRFLSNDGPSFNIGLFQVVVLHGLGFPLHTHNYTDQTNNKDED